MVNNFVYEPKEVYEFLLFYYSLNEYIYSLIQCHVIITQCRNYEVI